jgi:hypothetical protein
MLWSALYVITKHATYQVLQIDLLSFIYKLLTSLGENTYWAVHLPTVLQLLDEVIFKLF